MHFLHIGNLLFSGRGAFVLSRLRGTQPPVHRTQVWAPAGLRGARSGCQSRAIWQVITGSLSAEPCVANQVHGNPLNFIFTFCALLLCIIPVSATSTTPALKRCIL